MYNNMHKYRKIVPQNFSLNISSLILLQFVNLHETYRYIHMHTYTYIFLIFMKKIVSNVTFRMRHNINCRPFRLLEEA